MTVVENSPQNARNCTIFQNFLRDMPLRGMYIKNPRNFKVGPPPEKSCIRPWIWTPSPLATQTETIIGITGKIGNWLLGFLSNRNHFVRIPGGVSSDGSVLSVFGSCMPAILMS